MEHELWFTAILNKLLAGVITPMLSSLGYPPHDAAHPIPDYVAMQVLLLIVMVGAAVYLRSRLSVERPGKFQHVMEVVMEFTRGLAREIIGHGSERYVPMLATLGLFILLANLLGLIPTLLTPTGHIQMTLGLAVAAFLYYNYHGIRHHGLGGYLRHFCGPMLLIAPLIFPVEIISNAFRLLSLSVRLYANMFVGELLEHVFAGLIPILVPALMMALHVFVSFIQAYIFMLLPAVYISMAVAEEH